MRAPVERAGVVRCLSDFDAVRVMEAVAVGDGAAFHAHDAGLDDLAAVQDGDPVHRTHELGFEIGPAHAPGDRNPGQGFLDYGR